MADIPDAFDGILDNEEWGRLESEAHRLGYESPSQYLVELARENGLGGLGEESDLASEQVSDQKLADFFQTHLGKIVVGDSRTFMQERVDSASVDLIFTSPPFGLINEKEYGNKSSSEYLKWFSTFAGHFHRILKDTGSLVVDIGGGWNKGKPTRSLYHFDLLSMLCRRFGFHLAQEFYWWNPAKLPTPAEWVTIRRIRVKDAVNCVWWLSKTPYPKVSNRRVLQPYSDSMEDLLENGYESGERPSGHDISDQFQRDNKGSIPPNLLAIANTESNSRYLRYCSEEDLPKHPARFPSGLPAFFIRMLTDRGDTVFDPFAGSCVTGEAAEALDRQWICCEKESEYAEGALGRFKDRTGSLLPGAMTNGRDKPYEVYPPNWYLISEEEAPLKEDGGRSRK